MFVCKNWGYGCGFMLIFVFWAQLAQNYRQTGWLRNSGWLQTLMHYVHKPSYKTKNYLKYFILTVPLLWIDLCESVKVKKIMDKKKKDGLHFRSVCLSYFEIRVLTLPKNVSLISISILIDSLLKSVYPWWSPMLYCY